MARAKKNETTMTLEEKLEQALVPDWEWPYKLPSNWCWVYQKALCHLFDGEKRENASFPYWDVKSLRGTKERQYVSSGKFVRKGAKVILVDGENSGEIFDIPEDGYMGSTFKALLISPLINVNYLRYYIASKQDFYRKHKVGSAIPHLNKEMFWGMPFPLAPCIAQQHVVDHIESLFARLDEAKEKAQATLDSFETRKASILHKALTGELTAKWREQSKITKDSWSEKTLESVCKSIFDGDHMPPPKAASGIHFLVISNVNTGFLSFDDTRFVPKEYYDSLSDTRKPERGDVLYTLVGSFGIPVIVNTDTPFCFQRHMALLKPSSINTTFLWYLLQSQEMYQKAAAMAKGVAQLTVPIKGLRQMKFCCPTDKEQLEIVRLLDQLLIKEREAKESAESVLEQIDLIKKAILSRAFRGELGTNDPNEESALELLKSSLADSKQKTEDKPIKKRVIIPDEIAALLSSNLEKELIKVFYKEDGGLVSMSKLMAVSSKKFEVISAIKKLQQKGIIQKTDNGDFKLMR